MKKTEKTNNLLRFLKLIYIKIVRINDTPQKISLGLGLGIFLGILPGTGPVAALFFAWLLRLNQASALIGSLLTNTWLSIVTFLLSIKVGSVIMGLDWQQVYKNWQLFIKDFHWINLLKLSLIKIILPVIVGYFIISLCLGLLTYLITLIILTKIRHYENKN